MIASDDPPDAAPTELLCTPCESLPVELRRRRGALAVLSLRDTDVRHRKTG
jgi:hypothetical protein